jgi:hypothetical protein
MQSFFFLRTIETVYDPLIDDYSYYKKKRSGVVVLLQVSPIASAEILARSSSA